MKLRSAHSWATLVWAILALCALPELRASEAGQPRQLRVLSYNIHHGAGTDGRLDLPRIAQVIRGAQPDLVSLQEVEHTTLRTGGVDQTAELARLTDMRGIFGANIPYQDGHYGNAVLSRLPIVRHENHPLPALGPGERRGVLEVEVEFAGQPLLLFATHLDHRPNDQERRASAEMINRLVGEATVPVALLAGDLNAVPHSPPLDIFRRAWSVPHAEPLLTSPAGRPRRQIDYVLVRPANAWRCVAAQVLDEPIASDHRPLLVTLERVETAEPVED